MLDDRAKLLLKALVERYIADGQPVGSRTLSRPRAGFVSRHHPQCDGGLGRVGAYCKSPHLGRACTYSPRLPLVRGHHVDGAAGRAGGSAVDARAAAKVIANAAHLLSSLSPVCRCGHGTPPQFGISSHRVLETVRTPVLVIIVSPEGDVQNRVIFTDSDYSQSQLVEAANFLNAHYAGLEMEQVRSA